MKFNYLIAALFFPVLTWAQNPDKNKEVEQIVITKKGPASEKLNIIIDGDHVTVNGDPIDRNDKNSDVSVTRRKIKDMDVWTDDGGPGERRIIRRYSSGPQMPGTPMQPNKAMLGVVTRKADQGVEVAVVAKESAAEIAGLKEGDIITELDRKKIENPDDLSTLIRDKKPGDKVTIGYTRDNKQHTAVAELKKWAPEMQGGIRNLNAQTLPGFDIEEFRDRMGELRDRGADIQMYNPGFSANRAKLGVKIQDLDKGPGVKIIDVEEGSDAAKAGLKAGDVIRKVDGQEIAGADDMRSKVLGAKPGNDIQLETVRNNKTQKVTVHLSKKIKTADL